jgi:hypothetical protein
MSNPYNIPVVQSVAELRLIPYLSILANKTVFCLEGTHLGSLFTYDSSSSSTDNGTNVIKPTDNAGNGRWLCSGQYFPGFGSGGVDASGYLSVGGSGAKTQYTPVAEPPIGLGLVSDSASNPNYFCTTSYGTNNESAWHCHVARGTQAAPTKLLSGDNIISMGFRAYNSTTNSFEGSSLAIQGILTENADFSYTGAKLTIETTPNGGGQIRAVNTTFNPDLSMTPTKIGIGTNTPSDYIEISKTANSAVGTTTRNGSTGTSGSAIHKIQNATTDLQLIKYSSGYTTSGTAIANASLIQDNGAGLNLANTASVPMNFWTNGTKKMIIGGGGAVQMTAYGAGTATFDASGNITSVSDPSLKDDKGAYTHGLDAILAVDPRWYQWTEESGYDTDGTYAGFMATDDFPVPGAVSKNTDGINSLSDRAIIAALVNAVKELKAEIEELKK